VRINIVYQEVDSQFLGIVNLAVKNVRDVTKMVAYYVLMEIFLVMKDVFDKISKSIFYNKLIMEK
jgi:hypothetical protein